MKILVCAKRVIDYNVRVQIKRDGDGVVTDGIKMSINPFDEIAIEEALRIRDRELDNGRASEVVVASIGPADTKKQLHTALAMGADSAILIETDDAIQPLGAARIFLDLIGTEDPHLVIMGKQAIDDDSNQTGQMLAALWQRPQATFVSRLELTGDTATATREVDAGLETISVDLPAVITTDLRLNEPRFVKMPDIMKAKRKPMTIKALTELDVDLGPRLEIHGYAPPPARQAGIMVESVEELVAALRDKGLV